MRIGVSGASGHLGKAVVTELIERGSGHEIVGISRSPATVHAAVEARHGDYDQPEALIAAYRGLDRLLIIPSSEIEAGRRDRHFAAAIDASTKVGVRHVVMMSIAAAREVDEREMYAAYFAGEQHLMRSAERWTILRMNYYAESFAQVAAMSIGSGVVPGLGENHVAFVSRDDVAAAAAGILLSDGHAGAIYNATGPAAISGRERAELLSEITGKPINFVALDEAQLRGGMVHANVPKEYISALIDIERRFLAGDFNIVTGDVRRLAGRGPRPLRAVLSMQFSAPPVANIAGSAM